MTMYQYIAANTNWYVVSVLAPRTQSMSWPSNANTEARPKVIVDMEHWCDDNFKIENKSSSGDSRAKPHETWGYSYGDFFFKNEADAMLFVLRWSGEV
jgi:hypothetical protein